jgi:hypothetical protein
MGTMRAMGAALAALPLLGGPLLAGVVLQMEDVSSFQGGSNKSSLVQYVEPEFARLEISVNYQDPGKKGRSTQKSVVITRLDKKVIWTLIPEQNGYCEFTFDDLRKAAKSGSSLAPAGASPAGFKYEKKSGSRQIAGFKAGEYAFSGKDLKGRAWVSEDKKLKPAAEFNRRQAAALGAGGGKEETPGVLMAYDAAAKDSTHKMEVKSVKFQETAASSFELPKGYTRLNSSAWKQYQKNFDSKLIVEQLKKQVKEEAKTRAVDKGKEAAKQGLKGLLGR